MIKVWECLFYRGKAEFTELFPIPKKYCTKQLRVSAKGSVLMSVRAPVGDVNLADRKYIIGRGLSTISLRRGNNRFLFYLLLHSKKKIEAKSFGSTFKAINKSTVYRLWNPPAPTPRTTRHCPRFAVNPRSESRTPARNWIRAWTQSGVDGLPLFTRYKGRTPQADGDWGDSWELGGGKVRRTVCTKITDR